MRVAWRPQRDTMPRSCSLPAHSLAAGVRPLFERIDEMRADARVAFVNLVLLRIVVVQRAQRLRLHAGWKEVLDCLEVEEASGGPSV